MNVIDRASQLAASGQATAAIGLLKQAGRSGDSNALFELALWYLEGHQVPRDLPLARSTFEQAARGGHGQARTIHLNLLANGMGGPRDWTGALAQLSGLAAGNREAERQRSLLTAMALDAHGNPRELPALEVLSTLPKVHLFSGFASPKECRYLIDRAAPLLSPSVVVDPASGRMIPHPVRTSENAAFPWVDEDPVIHAINRRIAAASRTDPSWGEPLQILRYRPGQEYRPHHDAIPGADNQRIATFLLYLNEGYGGGGTEFLKTGLRISGRTGDGLLFWNVDNAGQPDRTALHAGLPVTAGEKLLATRWIHQRAFGPMEGVSTPP